MPFNRPKKVLLSLLAASSLLYKHLNRSLLKYSSSVRFLLLTIRNLSLLVFAGGGGSSWQGRLRGSMSRVRGESRKKVRGAMISGRRTVRSSFAGS